MKTSRRIAPVLSLSLAALILVGCTGTPSDLPSGLPEGLPVAAGEVSNQVSVPDEGNWSFSVAVADAEAQQAAVTTMTDDGWTLVGENVGESQSTYALTKGTQNASVLLTSINGDPVVVYNLIDTAVAAPAQDETPEP